MQTLSRWQIQDPEIGEPGIRVRIYDATESLIESRHLDVAELEDSQTGWLAQAEPIELSATLELPHPMAVQLDIRGPGSWHIVAEGPDEHITIPYREGPSGGFFRPRDHATTVHVTPGTTVTASTRRAELPRILGLVVGEAARSSATAIADAVAASRDCNIAVVVVGFTPDQETEDQDKNSLARTGDQDALVAAIAASAHPHSAVVVNAATPVLMPWLDQADAVLFAGLPGQEAGDAIAAALSGQILPEGWPVTTFPARDGHGQARLSKRERATLEPSTFTCETPSCCCVRHSAQVLILVLIEAIPKPSLDRPVLERISDVQSLVDSDNLC
ncbi:glycoside hydrolase family 3 C-terminal domain-containing protein [Paraburkholderia sp. J8-2]|uniref:glycoside hydrolase family 3 protein n=1 Tax=Paraburkholderia sp. J8-2 TaxID=2805440 RepID=UPI002AB79B2D|nr:glycoside hydrolase family 3 C-terminal domain-containing protein [Paraburkholderia sp. J8-2]